MSFSSNGSSRQQSEINVTPLIDVLLVLLIIFMVIVPLKPSGLRAVSPQPATPSTPATPDPTVIVLAVQSHAGAEPTYAINQQPIEKSAIVGRLRQILEPRQSRDMFVKGDADLEFSAIAEVISLGHQANADNIGVLTPNSVR